MFVVGVEAAANTTVSDNRFDGPAGACVGFTDTPNMRCQTSFDNLFTAGGRLGWTPANQWLLYGSGGFASAVIASKLTALNTVGLKSGRQ